MEQLTFDEYVDRALLHKKEGLGIVYPALKLCGEAGEVAEKIGKIIRDKGGRISENDRSEIAKELGDVLWYVASVADEIGYDFETIGRINLNKLDDRAARGVIGGSGDNR